MNFINGPVCFKHFICFYFHLATPVKTSLLSFQVTAQKENEYTESRKKNLRAVILATASHDRSTRGVTAGTSQAPQDLVETVTLCIKTHCDITCRTLSNQQAAPLPQHFSVVPSGSITFMCLKYSSSLKLSFLNITTEAFTFYFPDKGGST